MTKLAQQLQEAIQQGREIRRELAREVVDELFRLQREVQRLQQEAWIKTFRPDQKPSEDEKSVK